MLRFERILACIDGSDFDRPVIDAAVSMARAFHVPGRSASLRLVTVVDTPPLLIDEGIVVSSEPFIMAEQEAEALLAGVRAELPEGIEATGELRRGVPAREIAGLANGWPADLVVIGSHGRSGIDRLLLGSVAESVLRHVTCPMLVVRNQEKRD